MNFKKLAFWTTLFTTAAVPLATAQNPTILQGNYITNVFGQSNFVLNPNAQTNVSNVTATNTTVTRSTTTPLVATTEFNVAVGVANGTAVWALRSFDAGMKNQNCEARFTYRGFQATSLVQIKQSTNVVAQLTLTPSTDPRIASINFPCGDLSTATTFVVTDTATLGGINEIGGIYVGLATNQANVAQATKVGGWDNILCGAEASLTSGSLSSWLAPNVAGTCSGTAVGLASAASSNLNTLTFAFNNLPPGEYVLLAPVYVYPTSVTSGSARCDGRIRETTLNLGDGGNAFSRANTTEFQSIGAINQFKFQNPSTGNRIFQIEFSRALSTSACSGGFLNFGQNLSLYRFPSSSELVVTPERQNVFAAASWAGNMMANRTSTAETNVSDASFATNRTVFGKAQFTSTANDVAITVENMPPGTYRIELTAAKLGHYLDAATNDSGCTFYLKDGTNTAEAASTQYGIQYSKDTVSTATQIVKYSSIATRTFTASYAASTATQQKCIVDKPKIIITPLDQPSNSALYVQGPVLGAQTGASIAAGYVGESKYQESTGSFTTSTTENTFGVITGATIDLTPGVWEISGYAYAGFPTFTGGAGTILWVELYNGTDSARINAMRFGSAATGVSGSDLRSGSIGKVISITANKTIQLRGAYQKAGGGESVTAGATFPSGFSYIKATRLN